MEALDLYALAQQMATAGVTDREGRRLEPADLFPTLEYLWGKGVDLRPAMPGKRLPAREATT